MTMTPTNSTPGSSSSASKVHIPDRVYFRIGDVADLVGVKPYVLRYWETEFPMIQPEKARSGQRVYRRSDVETVLLIKHLLYDERYSIEGARKRIRELRRDGELKSHKQAQVSSGVSPERIKKLLAAARELQSFAQQPISKLFTT
jgi:DNA-binding transcriptional MerR regulator